MSVMPIVCDTVADGLACGKRTFGGCCANASEVAAAMMEIEMSNMETRLIEIIFVFPLLRNVARIINGLRKVGSGEESEFTTFYKVESMHLAGGSQASCL